MKSKLKSVIIGFSKQIFLVFLSMITLILALPQPVSADTVITAVYPSFSSSNIGAFKFNGVAAQSGSAIVLTPSQSYNCGSVWWKNKVTLADQRFFSAYFSFDISQIAVWPGAGDGITFAIQTQTNGPSTQGGGMGYMGITPSVGIEFDTYNNGISSLYNDTNGNHVGIDTNGSMKSVAQTPPA